MAVFVTLPGTQHKVVNIEHIESLDEVQLGSSDPEHQWRTVVTMASGKEFDCENTRLITIMDTIMGK